MIIEQIQRMNKATFFWKWCGFWTLAAGAYSFIAESVCMSHVTKPLPLDHREYAVIAGIAGILVGAAGGLLSGVALLLGFWLKSRFSRREPASRYARERTAGER